MLGTGLIMPVMGYLVMAGRVDANIVALSFPLMCYALFFILSVELPDIEADQLGGKRNLLTLRGWRSGIRLSLAATLAATLSFIAIAFLGTLQPVNMWAFVLLSLVPLLAALYGLLRSSGEHNLILLQVKLNFGVLFLILVGAVVYLAILA
jgi:1,4-dihydroxy-2-naphthoate octaprenyltransferase